MGNYSLKNITMGIGIGLIISSMINISMISKDLTVEEIKQEAAKNNLIVLTKEEILNNQAPVVTPTPTPTQTAIITPTPTKAAKSAKPAPTPTIVAKPAKPAPTPTPKPPAAAGKVTVNVVSGMTSESIADMLKEKGIIKDTKAFLKRIGEAKVDDKLKVGSFDITKGSGYDDIIKILTR